MNVWVLLLSYPIIMADMRCKLYDLSINLLGYNKTCTCFQNKHEKCDKTLSDQIIQFTVTYRWLSARLQ